MNRLLPIICVALATAIAPAARAQQAPTPSEPPSQTPGQATAPSAAPAGTEVNGHPLQTVGKVGGRTYRWTNGWAWMTLGDDAKVSMVVGIEQGVVLAVRENWSAVPKGTQQTLVGTAERLTVGGVSFDQVVYEMDRLYLDPDNDLIPVVDAYLYVVLELKKTPADQLKKFLNGLRKTYKPPPIVMKPTPMGKP